MIDWILVLEVEDVACPVDDMKTTDKRADGSLIVSLRRDGLREGRKKVQRVRIDGVSGGASAMQKPTAQSCQRNVGVTAWLGPGSTVQYSSTKKTLRECFY